MKYKVNEMFYSIQGEGVWSGKDAAFIRLQGCSVGCPWCDTKYTWKEGGEWHSSFQVVEFCGPVSHVVITGGEPTLWDLDAIISPLKESGKFVQIETSGQNSLKGQLRPSWITWSPKENLGFKSAIPDYMIDEIKWVVDKTLDYLVVAEISTRVYSKNPNVQVCLMPEGSPPDINNVRTALNMLSLLAAKSTIYRYSDRLHTRIGIR